MNKNICRILYVAISIMVNVLIWRIIYLAVWIFLVSAVRGIGVNGYVMTCMDRLVNLLLGITLIFISIIINYFIYKIMNRGRKLIKVFIIVPVLTSIITFIWFVSMRW